MSGDDVHDSIDHARDDWSVSDDAMRWTPEPPERAVRGLSGGMATVFEILSRMDEPAVRARLVEEFTADAAPLVDAVQRFGRTVGRALDGVAGWLGHLVDRGTRRE